MLASAIVLLAVCGQSAAAPVDVCHNGYLILRLRVPAWGMTPEQRAVIVTQRFTSLVSDALERQAQERPVPWPTARYLRGQWVVEARGTVLTTVTLADAAANRTSPDALARLWAGRFREGLAVAITGRRGVAKSSRGSGLMAALPPTVPLAVTCEPGRWGGCNDGLPCHPTHCHLPGCGGLCEACAQPLP